MVVVPEEEEHQHASYFAHEGQIWGLGGIFSSLGFVECFASEQVVEVSCGALEM